MTLPPLSNPCRRLQSQVKSRYIQTPLSPGNSHEGWLKTSSARTSQCHRHNVALPSTVKSLPNKKFTDLGAFHPLPPSETASPEPYIPKLAPLTCSCRDHPIVDPNPQPRQKTCPQPKFELANRTHLQIGAPKNSLLADAIQLGPTFTYSKAT